MVQPISFLQRWSACRSADESPRGGDLQPVVAVPPCGLSSALRQALHPGPPRWPGSRFAPAHLALECGKRPALIRQSCRRRTRNLANYSSCCDRSTGGGRSTRSGEKPRRPGAGAAAAVSLQRRSRLCRSAVKSCSSRGISKAVGSPSQAQAKWPKSRGCAVEAALCGAPTPRPLAVPEPPFAFSTERFITDCFWRSIL